MQQYHAIPCIRKKEMQGRNDSVLNTALSNKATELKQGYQKKISNLNTQFRGVEEQRRAEARQYEASYSAIQTEIYSGWTSYYRERDAIKARHEREEREERERIRKQQEREENERIELERERNRQIQRHNELMRQNNNWWCVIS